jgi:hypothetical protein
LVYFAWDLFLVMIQTNCNNSDVESGTPTIAAASLKAYPSWSNRANVKKFSNAD